jgi:ppGpp synthetase/RelA/SpoT-type nucleotidyltranferase
MSFKRFAPTRRAVRPVSRSARFWASKRSSGRSAHSFPLNTFQTTLRKAARTVDESSLVAQRLKRLSSIDKKLKRFKELSLSEVQDVAGCRAVLGSVRDADRLVSGLSNGQP